MEGHFPEDGECHPCGDDCKECDDAETCSDCFNDN